MSSGTEIWAPSCKSGSWTSVRGAGVQADSPAERGRSVAERLDGGEHTLTLGLDGAVGDPAALDRRHGIDRVLRLGRVNGVTTDARYACEKSPARHAVTDAVAASAGLSRPGGSGNQVRSCPSSALANTRSLRITATTATFPGFPWATS